jgi:hypothetical protein
MGSVYFLFGFVAGVLASLAIDFILDNRKGKGGLK